MKKNLSSIVSISVFFISLLILLITVYSKKYEAQIKLNLCSAMINENIENLNYHLDYKRTISILNGNGFLKQTGYLYASDNKWRYNRFTTFNIKHLSDFSYRLTILETRKSNDDNTPDDIITKLYPESRRKVHVTKIEEIEPRIWLFSGLEFPLFACKVPF